MTRKARALGMRNTIYRNANGLPNDDQVTTARDQALLGIAIQERFPKYYRYFSLASFVYRGSAMRNHNHLLGKVEGVDGIKTGFTRDFGFNLVTSVRRGPRRIVAVVLGGRSAGSRDARMRELIEANIAEASTKPGVLVAETRPEPQRPLRLRSRCLPLPSPRRFRSARVRPRGHRGDFAGLHRAAHAGQGQDRHGEDRRAEKRRNAPAAEARAGANRRAAPGRARKRRWRNRSRPPRRSTPPAPVASAAGDRDPSGRSRQAAGDDGRRQGGRRALGPNRAAKAEVAKPRPKNTSRPLPATPPSAAAGRSRSAPTRTKAKPSSI